MTYMYEYPEYLVSAAAAAGAEGAGGGVTGGSPPLPGRRRRLGLGRRWGVAARFAAAGLRRSPPVFPCAALLQGDETRPEGARPRGSRRTGGRWLRRNFGVGELGASRGGLCGVARCAGGRGSPGGGGGGSVCLPPGAALPVSCVRWAPWKAAAACAREDE